MGGKILKISVKKFSMSLLVFVILFSNTVFALAADLSSVKYSIEPKIVRIQNNNELKDYLSEVHNGNYVLAADIKERYFNTYTQELKISQTSIAVEILGHVYPDKISRYLPSFLRNKIVSHTNVIDIGEKSVDSNRWIWDSIAAVIDNNNKNYSTRSKRSIQSIEDKANVIIKQNPNLKLDINIIKLVLEDLENGNIDPILLHI